MRLTDHNGKAFEISRYGVKFLDYCSRERIPVLDQLPDGWKFNEQATTAPSGFKWANNGQPIFIRDANGDYCGNPKRQYAVIRVY